VSIDEFLVQVEWRSGRRAYLIERIEPAYALAMRHPVRVEVQDVDRVPRSSSGKFRLVESSVGGAARG